MPAAVRIVDGEPGRSTLFATNAIELLARVEGRSWKLGGPNLVRRDGVTVGPLGSITVTLTSSWPVSSESLAESRST